VLCELAGKFNKGAFEVLPKAFDDVLDRKAGVDLVDMLLV
jgi:hypothetical protein